MLEILDSLIATISVVLVLSLIVQAIQQIIKQAWSFKSSYMEREILAMFQQRLFPAAEVFVKDKGLDWRPIALQARQTRDGEPEIKNLIALLRSKLAAIGYNDLSLLETMDKKQMGDLLDLVWKDLDEELKTVAAKVADKNLEEKLKTAAADVLEKGQKVKDAIDKAKKDVENWYDLTLKAFQDHYERRMKMWSYVLSLVVVVGLNASLFDIYTEFSANKALRESAIALGSKLTSMPRDSVIVKEKDGKSDTTVVTKSSNEVKKEIKKNVDDIRAMLDNDSFQIMRWGKSSNHEWPVCALGWFAMTLLVGLGAPFWYDFLKAIMGIKNSLNKRDTAAKN
jgi:hypothetical protein